MTRPGLPILILLLLGALASFLRDPSELIAPTRSTDGRESRPQTYAMQTRSLTFNEYGELTDIMEADSVEYFERRNESLLEQPRFYSHNEDDKTWSASARHGRYRPGTEVLVLTNDVVLTNDSSGGQLKTEKMTIRIADQVAFSDVPVEILQGPNRIQADGMRANLELEQVRMAPNVESIYVNPR